MELDEKTENKLAKIRYDIIDKNFNKLEGNVIEIDNVMRKAQVQALRIRR